MLSNSCFGEALRRKAAQGGALQCKAWPCEALHGVDWPGPARLGWARHGTARVLKDGLINLDLTILAWNGWARLREVWPGTDWRGVARRGKGTLNSTPGGINEIHT